MTNDQPIKEQKKGTMTFKLRSDAQPYVPIRDDEPDAVKEPWEIFLDQKKLDLVAKGLRRQKDGSYTAAYRNLLVRPARGPSPQWGKPEDFDVRGNWRAAAKRATSPPPKKDEVKKRKLTTLKKQILAQRDAPESNPLWLKFEAQLQKADGEAGPIEVKKAKVQDDLAVPGLMPFGLSDRCYLSDGEGKHRGQRHREESHAIIREYVPGAVTEALEASVTALLHALRQLRMQELGIGQKPKRYAVGFREATRLLGKAGVQCLVVAPDVERTGGALEDRIAGLVQACEAQSVPVVFALSRRQLGAAIQKNVTVSVLAIQEVRGCSELFQRMLDEANAARLQ